MRCNRRNWGLCNRVHVHVHVHVHMHAQQEAMALCMCMCMCMRTQEAMASGAFDALPGRGKPLCHEENVWESMAGATTPPQQPRLYTAAASTIHCRSLD